MIIPIPLRYSKAILNKKNMENTLATLKEQVRETARIAQAQSMHEDFDAMSWLDLALEEHPESFDIFFDTAWDELSENERQERTFAIRKVL